MNNKIKFKIIFLKEIEGKISVVKTKILKNPTDIVSIADKSFRVDYSQACYSFRNILMYFINYDNGNQYSFREFESKIDPRSLDLYVKNKIIKELSAGSINSNISKWTMVFLVVFGVILGFTIGYMYMQNKILEMINQSVIPMP